MKHISIQFQVGHDNKVMVWNSTSKTHYFVNVPVQGKYRYDR